MTQKLKVGNRKETVTQEQKDAALPDIFDIERGMSDIGDVYEASKKAELYKGVEIPGGMELADVASFKMGIDNAQALAQYDVKEPVSKDKKVLKDPRYGVVWQGTVRLSKDDRETMLLAMKNKGVLHSSDYLRQAVVWFARIDNKWSYSGATKKRKL